MTSSQARRWASMFLASAVGVCGAGTVFAAEWAGTVLAVKGRAAKVVGSRSVALKGGERIEEGASVTTYADSSVKLMLQDRSELSLGANSSMRLELANKQDPAVVALSQGQMRAKVTRDPAVSKPDARTRPKFFFRTKSATLGVRGTDLEIVYNAANNVTALVTFEGGVSFAKDDASRLPQDPRAAAREMEDTLNGAKSVLVTEGQFSSSYPNLPEASIPTKLSPSQFETLKAGDSAGPAGAAQASKDGSKFLSPIPPGADPKTMVSSGRELENRLGSVVGQGALAQAVQSEREKLAFATDRKQPPPEGFFDEKTKAYAPPSGGFIDLKTGLYIAPPPGSVYDPNAGVYVPPPSFGGIDKHGAYVPPAGFQLDPNKGFVQTDKGEGKKAPDPKDGRKPGQHRGPAAMNRAGNPMIAGLNGMPWIGDESKPPTIQDDGFENNFNSTVRDPYCATCAPPPPPTVVPNTTAIKFTINVP